MCEPVTISATTMMVASLAISAAATGASIMAQAANAAKQGQYQNRMVAERDKQIADNATLANLSYNQEAAQMNLADAEKDAAASLAIQGNQRDAMKARATARVAAGEAGVSGLSVDSLLADFGRTEARYRDSIKANRENERVQLGFEQEGKRAEAEGRIQSVRPYVPQPIQQPDYLGAALRLGGSAFDAYDRFKYQPKLRANTPKP